MTDLRSPSVFQPNPSDPAGVLSWVHLGDLHMTLAGQQNHLDLLRLVQQMNQFFSDGSIAFVFLPGDVADAGSAAQYEVVRSALDQLILPWCAIVGDHDVHEKSFEHFRHYMAEATHYSFSVDGVHFFALNAFDIPDPGSFLLLSDQLEWLEHGLQSLPVETKAVLLLHCYPTDLKQGGGELRELIGRYPVRVIEMGHTHYNEVANDGRVLYIATRSTGQVEEGPVGFSITCIDGPVISWKFFPLEELPAVMITFPSDERFITEEGAELLTVEGALRVRAKAWAASHPVSVVATLDDTRLPLQQIPGSQVWQGDFTNLDLQDGVYELRVDVTDGDRKTAIDTIRAVVGKAGFQPPRRDARDQNNALGAWPERGLLGTQLGPNKYGLKW